MPTALLSVYDKAGIVELARGLHELGWRLVSSGGTAKAVEADGIPVIDVAELTGFPAILGHRVVTLHPAVHAGLLADLDQPEHLADLERLGIEPVALAVVNLYPFSSNPGIELIDVGGPTMVRAAAKNHAHVAVVVDPAQYEPVLDELRRDGVVSPVTRRRLARDAFAHTAAYDASIVTWFDEEAVRSADDQPPSDLPRSIHLALDLVQPLRYGENPHQQGARYRVAGRTSWWDDAVQHGGKELSYLNLYDTEAAWRLVHRFDLPTCVIVKHANPCGVASVTGTDDDMAEAYVRANACDPTSAFGGIVACNRPITLRLAEALAPVFTEVVVAPAIDDDALAVLTAKKNLRVLDGDGARRDGARHAGDRRRPARADDRPGLDRPQWLAGRDEVRTRPGVVRRPGVRLAGVRGGVVERHRAGQGPAGLRHRRRPAEPRRLGAHRRRAAGERAVGGVCASDAYFPFRDGLDTVAGFGVRAVIEPGGSIRDDEVIAAADEHGIAMVFTGERHFRH